MNEFRNRVHGFALIANQLTHGPEHDTGHIPKQPAPEGPSSGAIITAEAQNEVDRGLDSEYKNYLFHRLKQIIFVFTLFKLGILNETETSKVLIRIHLLVCLL